MGERQGTRDRLLSRVRHCMPGRCTGEDRVERACLLSEAWQVEQWMASMGTFSSGNAFLQQPQVTGGAEFLVPWRAKVFSCVLYLSSEDEKRLTGYICTRR
jgi:hypothetical protein